MKQMIWILPVLLLAMAGTLNAQTASFNFTAAPVSVAGWTNLSGEPSTGTRTVTAAGITITSTGNWIPYTTGVCAANGFGKTPGVYFPPAVLSNSWSTYNGTSHNLALYNSLAPHLLLSGLNKDSTYILRMSASNAYLPSLTQYTLAGAIVYNSQDLDAFNNTTQGVTFTQIKPDSNGVIKIFVNATASADIGIISGLQIFPGTASVGFPSVAISTPANGTILPEDGNVIIHATAVETGGTIAKVEYYADTTKIGEVDASPYNFTWTAPDPGSYTITVKATDNVGTIGTATANIAIQSLNYFWSTTGNIATKADSNFVGTVDTNRLAFRTNNTERMTILGDGTIGIGTKNTFGYLLAVNGTAIFTKVRVKTAGTWPDYVFKKGYVLPDLHDLEQYIAEHQHLPGIASEKEVQQDGIDVGDHQAALLKKVEELTLYLIEQNKLLKSQQTQIADQNARLEQLQKEIEQLRQSGTKGK